MQELRQFMFAHVYTNPVAKGEESKAMALLEQLFEYYMDHTDQLSETNLRMLREGEPKDRVICDYIAGMTDQYAIAKYNEYSCRNSGRCTDSLLWLRGTAAAGLRRGHAVLFR